MMRALQKLLKTPDPADDTSSLPADAYTSLVDDHAVAEAAGKAADEKRMNAARHKHTPPLLIFTTKTLRINPSAWLTATWI